MKKFAFQCSIFLPFILTSFFLLLPNVRAEEYTYYTSEDVIEFYSNYSSSLISLAESNFDSINSSYHNYVILYVPNSSSPVRIVYYSNENPLRWNSTVFDLQEARIAYLCTYSSDLSPLSSCSQQSYYRIRSIYSLSFPIVSSYNISIPSSSCSDTFNIVFLNNTYSFGGENDCSYIPTISFLYEYFNLTPPTPSDNTPILTTFYSTVGSKIGWLGEQIMSSYVYIAIFGVFILIFIIELLRRYFL